MFSLSEVLAGIGLWEGGRSDLAGYKLVASLVDRLSRKFSLNSESSLDDAVFLANYLFALGHIDDARCLLESFVYKVSYRDDNRGPWGSVGYGLILLAHIYRKDEPDKAESLITMLDKTDIFTDEMSRYEIFLSCLEDHQSKMDYAFTETPKYKCEVIGQEALTFLYFQEMIPVTREPLPDDYAATLQALVDNCYHHLRSALEESRSKGRKLSLPDRRDGDGRLMKQEGVQVLYSSLLSIDYRQFYVDKIDSEYDEDGFDLPAAFEGQANGLCGASQTGRLFLVAGIQAGTIQIDVLLHEGEPELMEAHEDVVECSISLNEPVALCSWGHEEVHPLSLPPGDYRVRYSIQGMDEDEFMEDDDAPVPGQSYVLQFWPAPAAADVVVRLGSQAAAYWHKSMLEARP